MTDALITLLFQETLATIDKDSEMPVDSAFLLCPVPINVSRSDERPARGRPNDFL